MKSSPENPHSPQSPLAAAILNAHYDPNQNLIDRPQLKEMAILARSFAGVASQAIEHDIASGLVTHAIEVCNPEMAEDPDFRRILLDETVRAAIKYSNVGLVYDEWKEVKESTQDIDKADSPLQQALADVMRDFEEVLREDELRRPMDIPKNNEVMTISSLASRVLRALQAESADSNPKNVQ